MKVSFSKQLALGAQHLKSVDPTLALVIEDAPLPSFTPHTNYYQELVESIISQQLSVKAAAAILKRFRDLYADSFPEPSAIIATSPDDLRAVGLSWQKVSYVQDLASKVLDTTVSFDHLETLTNDEVVAELTQIKGVGVWTVHMFLMGCMGRLDILPVGDLGIKNAFQQLYGLSSRPSTEDMIAIAEKNNWHPYESVASWYLWHSLDNKT